MTTTENKNRLVVVKIESYEGDDTYMRCGDERQNYLYAIVSIDSDGNAEIIDSSYRTLEEAVKTWPEVAPRQSITNRES